MKPTETSVSQNDSSITSRIPRSSENVAMPTVTASPTKEVDEVNRLKRQLEEKNRACETLTKKVEELQEASQLAAERHLLVSENFCKVCTDFVSFGH